MKIEKLSGDVSPLTNLHPKLGSVFSLAAIFLITLRKNLRAYA
jgi:hypothetical protein